MWISLAQSRCHIFALRRVLGYDLYFEEAVSSHCLLLQFKTRYRILSGSENRDIGLSIKASPVIQSQAEKYKVVFATSQILATFASEVSMSKYE